VSSLDKRPADKLADIVINVLWQDLLEVFAVLRKKLDSEGAAAIKAAFEAAKTRFLEGPFENHIEVRWGMTLCPHCNDENIEKNGIAYVNPSGDGIEFNQCLNCNIGILYNLVVAKATMDSYVIGLGKREQFNGMSFYWNAIPAEGLKKFIPVYEIINKGEWIGSISFDESLTPRFLSKDKMTESTPRNAEEPWTTDLPEDVKGAVDAFLNEAKYQIEVALALR
jgi:hypothetical protein